MKINSVHSSSAAIVNEDNTSSAKESEAQPQDTLEIARHSKSDKCGKYKGRNLFHHRNKGEAAKGGAAKGYPAKGADACQLPAPVIRFHGNMSCNIQPCAGATHTFDVLQVEYPGPCHTIPMEYVVGGREHHITAPDLHVNGCPTAQIQPVVRFQPDTIHVYPGQVVDKRPQLAAALLECQQVEHEAACGSSSSSACAAPAKGEAAQECEQAQAQVQQGAAAASSSSSSQQAEAAQGECAQAQGEAAKGEAQKVAPFAKKHFRLFHGNG